LVPRTDELMDAPDTIEPAQTIASSADAESTNLAPGQLRAGREDRPLAVVEVERRLDGDQVEVCLVVRRQRPDVAPVVAVAPKRPGYVVVLEVVDGCLVTAHEQGNDVAAHVVTRPGVLGVMGQRLDEGVGCEDVVAHRGEDLVGAVDESRRVGGLLQKLGDPHPALVGGDDTELVGVLAGRPDCGDGHSGAGLEVGIDHL